MKSLQKNDKVMFWGLLSCSPWKKPVKHKIELPVISSATARTFDPEIVYGTTFNTPSESGVGEHNYFVEVNKYRKKILLQNNYQIRICNVIHAVKATIWEPLLLISIDIILYSNLKSFPQKSVPQTAIKYTIFRIDDMLDIMSDTGSPDIHIKQKIPQMVVISLCLTCLPYPTAKELCSLKPSSIYLRDGKNSIQRSQDYSFWLLIIKDITLLI